MKPGSKWLFVALAVTLAAAYWAPAQQDDQIVPVVKPLKDAGPRAQPMAATQRTGKRDEALQVVQLRSREHDEIVTGAFQVPRAAPAPKARASAPAGAVVAEPLAPQAPPLAFKVLGRYVDKGDVAVFLQHNDQNLVARAGETLLGQYKVEQIAGSSMTLLYLPLNQQQVLDLGPAPQAQ